MALSIEDVASIGELFRRNGWDSPDAKFSPFNSRFNVFCELFKILSSEERRLVLRVSRNFQLFSHELTLVGLRAALIFAEQRIALRYPRYFIVPIKKADDYDKEKSSDAAAYYFQHAVLRPMLKMAGSSAAVDSVRQIYSLAKYHDVSEALIFGIDEFVGTGDTVEQFIHDGQVKEKNLDNLIIISAASMISGVEKLKSMGLEHFCGTYLSRGISDFFDDREAMLAIMDGIEARIEVEHGFNRGYKRSESLVSFSRTPDNTFPIYWSASAKDGSPWPAPFPR